MKIYLGGLNAYAPLHNASIPLNGETEISLVNAFLAAGFVICESLDEADALVLYDMDIKLLKRAHKSALRKIPIIFVRNEPIVVWPANYNLKAISFTSKLIDVGPHSDDSNLSFPWPQDWNQNLDFKEVVSNRSEAVVLVCGNKLSFIKGETYSLRRECIYSLPDLDLYGARWNFDLFHRLLTFAEEMRLAIMSGNLPRLSNSRGWLKWPSNWKGATTSKLDTLSRYKYSLAIENSTGYLSEKIFDAFFARCIPIYVGPDVDKFGIPANLVVQVEPTLNSIERGIELAKAMDYEQWLASLNSWLMSDEVFNKWSATNVYDAIVSEIANFIETSLQ